MSALIALMLAQAAPPSTPKPLPPAVVKEFNVLAARLQGVKTDWAVSDKSGRTRVDRCRVTTSSGDRAVDAIPCRILTYCVNAVPNGIQTKSPEFAKCLMVQRTIGLARIADQRVKAGKP